MTAARLTSAIRVLRATVTDEQVERLRDELSHENPAWLAMQRSRSPVPVWLQPPRRLSMLRVDGGDLVLPRGASDVLRRVIGALEWVDGRTTAPYTFTLRRELRPEQTDAVARVVRAQQGIGVAPPGMGKTTVALAAIAAAGQRALVVAPTIDIVRQWQSEAHAVLGVDAAVIGGGSDEVGPLTIATFAAMRDADRRAAIHPLFGTFVADEAHGLGAPENARIVDESPAKFRFGFTATPHTDARGFIVRQMFGAVAFTVSTAKLVQAGRLKRVERVEVPTAWTYGGDPKDFTRLISALVEDQARNELVAEAAARECREGALGLVLSSRVAHARALGVLIASRGLRVGVLTGDVQTAKRAELLGRARSGELDVLCATTLADEGLDLPQLARVFLAVPSREGARFVQRVGRAMRVHQGKADPIVFDFVDELVGLLAYQARQRAKGFIAMWADRLEVA